MYGYVPACPYLTLFPWSSVPLAAGRDQGLIREDRPSQSPPVVTTGKVQLGVAMRRVFSLAMALAIVLSFGLTGLGQGSALAAGSSRDVWVGSYDGNTLVAGACLRLSPYSNLGCDQNRDGFVTFKAIPDGTYSVVYASVPGGYLLPAPRSVAVYGPGSQLPIQIPLETVNSAGSVDVSIQSIDFETGELLTGVCLSLRGYSNVGCDENGDGQVDFSDIPYGTYIIDVERYPAGRTLVYPANVSLPVSAYSGSRLDWQIQFTSN